MIAKLNQELVDALLVAGESELEVVDLNSQRIYFVVDAETHRQAKEALRRQRNREAIAQGIAEMDAGEGIPVEEARKLTRERLRARVS